jgi:hypothetical protein
VHVCHNAFTHVDQCLLCFVEQTWLWHYDSIKGSSTEQGHKTAYTLALLLTVHVTVQVSGSMRGTRRKKAAGARPGLSSVFEQAIQGRRQQLHEDEVEEEEEDDEEVCICAQTECARVMFARYLMSFCSGKMTGRK